MRREGLRGLTHPPNQNGLTETKLHLKIQVDTEIVALALKPLMDPEHTKIARRRRPSFFLELSHILDSHSRRR